MSYFSALIIVTAAAGAACLIAPEENSAAAKVLRVFAALCVLSVALSPLRTARERLGELFSSFEDFVNASAGDVELSSAANEAVGRELALAIEERVCEQYSLPADRVKVDVTLDTSDAAAPTLSSVRVSVTRGETTPDPGEIADFVTSFANVPASAVILSPDR